MQKYQNVMGMKCWSAFFIPNNEYLHNCRFINRNFSQGSNYYQTEGKHNESASYYHKISINTYAKNIQQLALQGWILSNPKAEEEDEISIELIDKLSKPLGNIFDN